MLNDISFEEAVSYLVVAGLKIKEVEEELKECCKYGRGTLFKVGKTRYKVDVVYIGTKRSDFNFWGHSTNNYLFCICL